MTRKDQNSRDFKRQLPPSLSIRLCLHDSEKSYTGVSASLLLFAKRFMQKALSLEPQDISLLRRKLQNAKSGLLALLLIGISVPILWAMFAMSTPTAWSTSTVLIVLGVGMALELPFVLKAVDLYRSTQRVKTWLRNGVKFKLVGDYQKGKFNTMIVNEKTIFSWIDTDKVTEGTTISVEYLPPEDPDSSFILGVLSIQGESNPFFVSVWRDGPPTP